MFLKNIGSLVYKAAFLYEHDITSSKVTDKTVATGANKHGAVTANGKPVAVNVGTGGSNASNTAAGTNASGVASGKPVATSTNTANNQNTAKSVGGANASSNPSTTGAQPVGSTSSNMPATGANTPVNGANTGSNTSTTGAQPVGSTSSNMPATGANTPANGANTATAKTGGATFDFVKPVYKDSLTGRDHFAGRSVATPNRYVINADSVEIRFMDNGIVDGDTISVYYNGQLIVPKLSLKEKPYIIKVPLFPDYPNRLVIHAESLGEYPPNTALVRIISGRKEESFLLSSSMSKSGSIELMNSPQPPKAGAQYAIDNRQ
jgi:hypothetical protein